MSIDKKKLEKAISLFHESNGSLAISSTFMHFYGTIHINSVNNSSLMPILSNLSHIIEDLWHLETLLYRLDRQRISYSKHELDMLLWIEYATCDVDLFFVTIRSIFDYLAQVSKHLAVKPKQTRSSSFSKLRNFVSSPSGSNRVGEKLSRVIISCDWFSDLCDLRDSIVHRGAHTFIFPDTRNIMFQIDEGLRNQIVIPEIMENDNIVIFELYAGMIMGYLLSFFEDYCTVASNILGFTQLRDSAENIHFAHPLLKRWIEQALRKAI
jgi:hypothetical protein